MKTPEKPITILGQHETNDSHIHEIDPLAFYHHALSTLEMQDPNVYSLNPLLIEIARLTGYSSDLLKKHSDLHGKKEEIRTVISEALGKPFSHRHDVPPEDVLGLVNALVERSLAGTLMPHKLPASIRPIWDTDTPPLRIATALQLLSAASSLQLKNGHTVAGADALKQHINGNTLMPEALTSAIDAGRNGLTVQSLCDIFETQINAAWKDEIDARVAEIMRN